MAEGFDSSTRSDTECEILMVLKESNGELEHLLQEINNTHALIKKYRDMLQEKMASLNISYCSSLDITDSVDKFVTEQLRVLMKPISAIHKAMDDLKACSMDEDRVLLYGEDRFWVLVSKITENQKSIVQIINDFNKNNDVYMFRQKMHNSQTSILE